jgi:hypothetical protein
MMANDEFPRLTDREIAAMFSHPVDAERFQPILNFDEAATLLRVPAETLRDWRSRGLLEGCCRKLGKRVVFVRDRLVKKLFNEGLRAD